MDIRAAEAAAKMPVDKLSLPDARQVQDGRVDVVNVDRSIHGHGALVVESHRCHS